MTETGVGDTPLVDRQPGIPAAAPGLDSTLALVERAKAGDREALDHLFARCLPSLRRWASGRLPQWTRGLMDTDDLVQETVIRAVKRIDQFESRHEGALQAYLRQAIVNRIRDEVRRTKRSPVETPLDDNAADHAASPLEKAIGAEALERYEAALARLRPEEREAIVARVEMDGSYQEVAQALGKPSPDAARMAVSRALLRLAEEMSRGAI
jgi:RNA polymerase sigma factor (sigma-70 family)